MPRTLLHVVYAGRGDALIVQDDSGIYLIDGGPLGYTPKRQGLAPYWTYYASALLEVWEAIHPGVDDVTPQGIVISHGHEDHYGGIERLFDLYLAPAGAGRPEDDKNLVFDKPLVTQLLDEDLNSEFAGLETMLSRHGFAWVHEDDPPDLPLFEAFAFGTRDTDYAVYERGAAELPARTWSVDVSAGNLASVLMTHRETGMVFTGDSVGYKVLPFLATTIGDETIPIFKVPHHGSLRNSQRGMQLATVPAPAWKQYALLCIGADPAEWNAIEMPEDLRDDGALAVARAKLTEELEARGLEFAPTVQNLRAAVQQTRANLKADTPDPFEYGLDENTIGAIWLAISRQLQRRRFNLRRLAVAPPPAQVPNPSRKRPRDDSDEDEREATPDAEFAWFAKQAPKLLSDIFYGEMAMPQLKGFFADFEARNYVISADGRHSHPSAETLAGISLASLGRQARVLVTDGFAVSLDRLEKLDPDWADSMEIWYLARGARMVLDPLSPDQGIDPENRMAKLQQLVSLNRLHGQFQNNRGATIRRRSLRTIGAKLRATSGDIYLRLDAEGDFEVTDQEQLLYVDQAWTLSVMNLVGLPFPASFDDVQLRVADGGGDDDVSRLVTLIRRTPKASLISVQQPLGGRLYVCSNKATDYLTDKLNDPTILEFEFITGSEEGIESAAVEAEAVTLRAFCETFGVPTSPPPSCEGILPELVGPLAAAELEDGIRSRLIERVLDWDANLDTSKVTYVDGLYGPLVTAARVEATVGAPSGFEIDGQQETIASAAVTLARPEEAAPLGLEARLTTADGTIVIDEASDPEPLDTLPLDRYLAALGVSEEDREKITTGTLLTEMLGTEPLAESLLITAPSPIVLAGIAEWGLDHEASWVAIEPTTTGDYLELRAAHLSLAAPAAIVQDVVGMQLSYSQISLEIGYARLPGCELALEAIASSGGTELAAQAVLSDRDCTMRLALPEGAKLGQLLAILPAEAQGIGKLTVPLAGASLESLGLDEPAIEIAQPSIGAAPYELAAASGSAAFSQWASALPKGWPAPEGGRPRVRVLDPAEPVYRRVALEVPFTTPIGAAKVRSVLRADPVPESASSPAWIYTLSAYPEASSQPLTAAALLGAAGLGTEADSLVTQLPGLRLALDNLAAVLLTVTLSGPEQGSELLRIDLGLSTLSEWELLPGVVTAQPAQVALVYSAGIWSAEVEGEAAVGGAGPVGISAQLSTPELAGAISFENAEPDFTVGALASLCGLGDLSAVPILGGLLGNPVDAVQLALTPAPGISLAAAGFSLAADPLQVGLLQLDWVGVEAARTLDPAPSVGFWLEAQSAEDLIVSLFYDDATEATRLRGTLRPIAEVGLGDALTRLLGTTAESTLMAAVAKLPIEEGSFVLESKDFATLSCGVVLRPAAALPVAAASAGQLSARWVAAHEDEKTKQEVPEAYALDGRLTRKECKYEAALEAQFRGDEEAKTVVGTIKALPTRKGESEEEKEAKKFTVTTLLELLDLKRPQVLTPAGAPEFFELEPTTVEATFSVEPFRLEALTIVVKTEKTLSLLAAPQPIELHTMALRVEYVREPKEGEPSISGVVLGDLPLQPKAVTLAYTEPKGEQAAFRAKVELKEEEAPDYRRLIGAEPYDPGYGIPDEPGLPAAIPMTSLTAVARPGEYVELSGFDPRTPWELPVGGLTLKVGALGGRVRVTPGEDPEAPHQFDLALFGRLEYHGFFDSEALFTWGPQKPSLLTAKASEGADAIDLAAIATDLGSRWEDLVPADTPAFAFTTAWTYADLTDSKAISLDLYGDGSLGSVAGPAALLSRAGAAARRNEFLFGAASSGAFPLAPLWPSLGAIADGYLSLAAGNLAALSEAGTLSGLEDDLGALTEAAKRQQAEYTAPFATLPPLAQSLPADTELGHALTLVAKVDTAGQGKLSGALARIAEAGSLGTRLAWGPVEHGEPERSRLEVDLRGLILLGGGISVEAVAEYVPSQAEALIAEGTTARVEIGASSYDFTGRLVIGVDEATFATGEERAPIPAPLGATGADFRNPLLVAVYRYPSGQPLEQKLRIGALVDLVLGEGGAEKGVTCNGAIEFFDGTAVVAVFQVPETIRATDVYLNRMTSGSWPTGYPSFPLEDPRFHAAPKTVTIEGTEYEAGYHALATTVFFAHPFPFDLTIEAAGLKGSGASTDPLDLVYLVLSEPEVSIATGASPAFALGGGAKVFKGDFGDTEFRLDPALDEWTAAAKYGSELVGVDEPEVRFAYTDADGLRVLDWPVKPKLDEEDDFDWEEELEEASEGSKCGKLEDLGLDDPENEDKTVETEFDLTMKQVGPLAGESLTLSLTGTYTVIVKGPEGETKTTMPFPATTGTIANAGSFQLDQLEDWVKETIEANHEALGKSLLEERDSDGEPGLESFLEGFDFEAAEAELLERILCREEGPEKVRKRTEKKLKKTEEQTTDKEKEATGELEKVETATTISLAFGFLITFFAWFTIAFGWVTGVCGLLTVSWWWLPLPLREEWEELGKKLEEAKKEGEETRIWAETELLKMRGVLGVAFTELTTVEVTWDRDNLPAYEDMDYEGFKGFSFDVEVATDPEFEDVVGTATVDSPASAASIAAAALGQSNYAFARMRPTYKEYPGTWITGRAFHLVPLPAPAPVSQALGANAETVEVSLTTVAGARSYTVELVDTTTAKVVAETELLAPDPQPQTLVAPLAPTIAGEAPPLLLLGRAKASGDPALNEDSPFAAAPEAEAIPTVGPPRNLIVSLVPDGVQVTWEPIDGATVTTQVRDSTGHPLPTQPNSQPIPNGCVLSGPGIEDGVELQVVARANAPGALQPWSAPVPFTVRVLAEPQRFSALFLSPENTIHAFWEPVAGAEKYEPELLDGEGKRLEPSVEPQPWGAILSGGGIGPGKFSLRVRASASERVSTWTAWLPIVAEALPAPAGPSLVYESQQIVACWSSVPNALGYPIELEGANGERAKAEPPAPPFGFGPAQGIEPQAGVRYTAKLRARVGDSLSAVATAAMTMPTLLEICERGWAPNPPVPVEALAAECLRLERALGPTQLTYTLLGAGYSSAEATAGVRAALPNTTPAEMAAIGDALLVRANAIGHLQVEKVSGAVIVALCHALYSPVPLQLAVDLKLLGVEGAGLAPAFAASFGMPAAEAEALVTAVFGEPWQFGAVALHEGAALPEVLLLLKAAWPEINKVAVKLLAALKGASSSEVEVRILLGVPPFGWFPWFTVPWQGVHSESTGVLLAGLLHNSGIGREEATRCVAACWPQLTPAQVAAAIETAYGPLGPEKDTSR